MSSVSQSTPKDKKKNRSLNIVREEPSLLPEINPEPNPLIICKKMQFANENHPF